MKASTKTILFILLAAVLLLAQTVSARDTTEADTGFRVGSDGFSFENYGSSVCQGYSNCYKVTNLTSVEMVRMFGTQVCRSISDDGTCTLSQSARRWMNEVNEYTENGHCEGMAVLSSLFYSGRSNPSTFGARTTSQLQLKGNDPLQREIAYWFATQWFMDNDIIESDPKSQVNYLIRHFQQDPKTTIPLGIFKADRYGRRTAGHAITAYAVVNHGNGIYYIMVYDNNYPNKERYITVDTTQNTWEYSASQNSWSSSSTYSGKGKTNPIQISPIEPRLGTFKCYFCEQQAPEENIWDILAPWISPGSPTAVPTKTPAPQRPTKTPAPGRATATPQPSDEGYSIWDILSPWISPSEPTAAPSRPTKTPSPGRPTATPQPSDEGYSIWDIFAPFIDPGDSSSPTESPDEGYSIWDIFAPFIDDSYGSPTATPQQQVRRPSATPTPKPTATPKPTSQPITRPTSAPGMPDSFFSNNHLSVSSDINIYIETDTDLHAGYDWLTGETYDEIEGVVISRTIYQTSATLPNNTTYYLWMNYPEGSGKQTFDAVISSPGRFLKLTGIQEAYESPNFVYYPPVYREDLGYEIEAFEVVASPRQLPGVEFVISDEYGEYSFKFTAVCQNAGKAIPEEPVSFIVYHNYNKGEVGIWVTPAYNDDKPLFTDVSFDVSGSFSLFDSEGELKVNTPASKPIVLKSGSSFFFNYVDWQNGDGLTVEIDLDGDNYRETPRRLN